MTARYFAKLVGSSDNQVDQVVVAPSEEWCETNLGGNWVETFLGHPTERFAGAGASYFPATSYKFVPNEPPLPPSPFVPSDPSGPVKMAGRRIVIEDNAAGHHGFPGFCYSQPGELMTAYRFSEVTHLIDTNAVIKARWSTDGGVTWSEASTIWQRDDQDPRDVLLTKLSDGRIAMTVIPGWPSFRTELYFSSDAGRTWGSPVYFDPPSLGYQDVVESPIIECANGDYLTALYGRPNGPSDRQSAIVMRSTDGGATWGGEVLIAQGGDVPLYGPESDGGWREPFVCKLANGDMICGLRHTREKFWWVRSTDDGFTWTDPVNSGFIGYARPAISQMSNGTLVTINRRDGFAWYRVSLDNGATWNAHPEGILDSAYRMAYAQMQQGPDPKTLAVVWAMEDPGQENSYLRFTYLYDETVSDPFPAP